MRIRQINVLSILLLLVVIPAVGATTEDDFLILINNERAGVGAGPLSINGNLHTAAQLHSQDMIDQDYFSHTSLDGRTYIDRINGTGYSGYTNLGENIAYHSGQADAQQVFDMWMGSSGHRANMLNPNFNELGLGVVTGLYTSFTASMYTLDLGRRTSVTPVCNNGDIETQACGVSNVGECSFGNRTRTCVSGQWGAYGSCVGAVNPSNEICNDGLDNDCDNAVDSADSNCAAPTQCSPGSTRSCNTNELGICGAGRESCNSTGFWTGVCNRLNNPAAESCNALDDNCNGEIDENACLPLSIEIVSPEQNAVLFSSSVDLRANLNRRANLVNIIDNGRKIASCLNCASFVRTFSFSAGNHDVEVEAFDEAGNELNDLVSFLVHISDLRIVSVSPSNSRMPVGENGRFVITYQSSVSAIGTVTVDGSGYSEVMTNSCPASYRTSCSFDPNFPEGIQGLFNVSYELEDEFGASARRNAVVLIDTKDPEISVNISIRNSTRSKSIIAVGAISEKSKVEYNTGSGFRRICSSCTRFSRGFIIGLNNTLDLSLRVSDLAGNVIEREFDDLG